MYLPSGVTAGVDRFKGKCRRASALVRREADDRSELCHMVIEIVSE